MEFRLGEIEALPVADATVDVVISNCVINLCPDKRPVYREAFRALRPGGRLAVSDVVAREELPDGGPARPRAVQRLPRRRNAPCGARAAFSRRRALRGISIKPKGNSDQVIASWESKRGFESKVFAAEVTAAKPGGACCAPGCCG